MLVRVFKTKIISVPLACTGVPCFHQASCHDGRRSQFISEGDLLHETTDANIQEPESPAVCVVNALCQSLVFSDTEKGGV